ncbi:hypothetical protein [Streptomyces sp. NPDC046887]|uniref:hypothetical protein n=1 Tax=Streptomyces sp. NPDC046887 TaxID=3155472 RepID=UPI0033E43A89
MSVSETSRYVRLRVELLLEITDPDQLTAAALERVESDEFLPDEERTHARSAVREDEAEALAYLVEPADLIGEVPGVDLAQASWSSERAEHDPEAFAWEEFDGEDAEEDGDYLDEDEDEDEDEADGKERGLRP